ncbi:MAG TPA: CPBP family glutamic-type intramembrane protease [Polyangia bacterium]|nr:CPBP family glutamic-type intramembrane protease [Polyangia bacterium]
MALAAAPARAQVASNPMTAPVPPELLARAASFDVGARLEALVSLQALATPAAEQLTLVMLQHDYEPRVRAAAATTLGASHDPSFLDPLAYAAAADLDGGVREAAAAAHAALLPFSRRPKAAAGFSALCPGCGYFYLGQPQRALAYLGGGVALGLAAWVAIDRHTDAFGNTQEYDDRATPFLMAIQNLWLYGIFASYRDARLARGDLDARYPVARDQLGELLIAPFNPKVLKSPFVWAGLPALLGGAFGLGYLASRVTGDGATSMTRHLGDPPGGVQFFGKRYSTGTGFALGETYNLGLFLPVGVGEESTFRGVIQAGLMETSLDEWGGWVVGSLIFGALHTFNFVGEENGLRTAALAVPYITLTGSYLGYVYIRKHESLATGVAIHFWYDFLLSTADFIADPDHQPFVMRFGMPF